MSLDQPVIIANEKLDQPVTIANEKLGHQIVTIESLGLTRRFDYDRDKDLYTAHAYA